MASPAPTPQDLYARLRERSTASSDEKMAHELGENAKTIANLKAGKGVEFDRTIRLLKAAGWLDLNGEADIRARLEDVERFVESTLAELRGLQQAVSEVPESQQ